ncbi:DUF6470 family protein [Cohnella caldifontis]|uniref:DUF6470 family protein n=1 Tax=Cohnella caldifontis TaxID=3027471 RepID=UPI0023EBCB46|nr:DUF6470 family protein [Cohnella sp. YIM B05605]
MGISVGTASSHEPVRPVQTVTPPAEVSAKHIPATMTIRYREAEIKTDWSQVWDDLGLKKPSAFKSEIEGRIQSGFVQDLSANVRHGDQTADIRRKDPGIFGKQAYEDYMRKSQRDVVIDVAPKSPVRIDVRIHAPEIDVQTRPLPGTR